jgi:uracil-DNA glycosylase
MNLNLKTFIGLIVEGGETGVFNPWRDRDELNDSTLNGPVDRLSRLRAHLSTRVARILIGEAAGYQGCRVSGCGGKRLSIRGRPWSEPSATIVWNALHRLDIAQTTILWNAYPWHPFEPGKPHSNRTPNRSERAAGLPILEALLNSFPAAELFAVGRHAQQALHELGVTATALRHPSMGGAALFQRGLAASLQHQEK